MLLVSTHREHNFDTRYAGRRSLGKELHTRQWDITTGRKHIKESVCYMYFRIGTSWVVNELAPHPWSNILIPIKKTNVRHFNVKIFLGFQSWQNPHAIWFFSPCSSSQGQIQTFSWERVHQYIEANIEDIDIDTDIEVNMKKNASSKRGGGGCPLHP